MTSHLFPTEPDPTHRKLVVLVHGFGSSKACWKQLLDLFKKDPQVSGVFDFACFEYPTAWVNTRPLQRIPRLLELARSLASFLELPELSQHREVVLVGHSQGGLVIQSYLVDKLNRGKVEDLYRLREVILIATPHLGSTLLSGTRKFLSLFFSNPQERALRVFDTEITDLRATITERIVGAPGNSTVAWPIPIQCFWGTQDGVVVEASARGPFDTDVAAPLNGDHFSILEPSGRGDERYKALADALLEPCGHRCVFEIDLYDIKLDVAPVTGSGNFEFSHGGRVIQVQTDNVAHLDRTVVVSPKNRCSDLFTLRYTTLNDGFLKVKTSHDNEATPQEQSAYETRGQSITFAFHPRKRETYRLFLEVYKGFDRGHRNAHFHLVPSGKKVYYKRVHFTLDLAAYLNAGWTITLAPKLYYFHRDQQHGELCARRVLTDAIPSLETGRQGVSVWELEGVREGLIDVVWDVVEPANAVVAASPGSAAGGVR